jgi:hypothetical protein
MRLWNAVRFIGHDAKDLQKNTDATLGSMSKRVFEEESTLTKIINENKTKKEKK